MSAPSVRLFALAAAMSAGVLVTEWARFGPVASFALGLAAMCSIGAGVVLARARSRATAAAFVAAVLFGACLAGLRLASIEGSALGRAGHVGADAVLDGRVLAQPREMGGVLRFPLGVSRATLDGRRVGVRERVHVAVRPPPERAPEVGDRLRVDARLGPLLREPRGPDAPALRAAAARLRWAGVSARAYARPQSITRVEGPRAPLDVIGRAGRAAVTRPALRIPARQGGLLLGVTIGDTSRLDPDVEDDFRTTGLTHLLAVSGGNVALLLGAIAFAMRWLRAGRRLTLVVLAVALASFAAVTRFEPSVMRAGVMASVALCGLALGTRRETLTALAVAALVLITFDPFIVHATGFQLSALATLGLLTLGPHLQRVFGGRVGRAAAVTLAAQLAVAPLVALTFHTLSLISIVANVLVVPAVGPATVLGILAAPAGAIWSGFGLVCVTLARPFLWWMTAAAGVLARVPHASIGTPTGVAGATVVALLVLVALSVRRIKKPPRFAALLLAVGIIAANDVWVGALAPPPPNGLEVTALDVGQGDAILVRRHDATMLVDGGPDGKLLLEKLQKRRIRRIDLLVLTHPHADHVDGLATIARRLRITRALDPGLPADLSSYADLTRTLRAKNVPTDRVRAGAVYRLADATVEVLAPNEPLFAGTASDLNNNSVVLRVRFGDGVVLLGGEVQEEGQLRLLESGRALSAHVFKVPHHGSPRMLREFYVATRAKAALIPVGTNDYGHPARACLDALAEIGARAYRTDRSGDVSIVVDAHGRLSVREQRPDAAAA